MMTTHSTHHRDRGFALPVAVFALVLVGVLVTGGFYMARQESRIGMASEQSQRAFYIAEQGMYDVLAGWDPAVYGSASAWSSYTVVDTVPDGIWSVDITPMTPRLYFLEAEGAVTRGGALLSGATRRVGVVARVSSAAIDPPAALTTQGSLKVGGSSIVAGQDSVPANWAGLCDPSSLTDKPGIMMDDTAAISYAGNSHEIDGNPAIAEDTTINTASMLDFGDLEWDDLVSLADIRFNSTETITNTAADSVLSGGSYRCDDADNYNWGDPLNPGSVCSNHFPIIYAASSLKINSSSAGQGILLIEDDLSMAGGFTFYGPVIVKGTLSTSGTGGHFNGGVIAANVDLETSTVIGNALVQYSSCAVERAILNNKSLTRARPLASRSWVDLSSVSN